MFDNEAAAYDITTYVRSLGHQDVVFVEGPLSLHTSAQRLQGFERAGGGDRVAGGFAYEDGVRRRGAAAGARERSRTRSSPPTTRPRSAC